MAPRNGEHGGEREHAQPKGPGDPRLLVPDGFLTAFQRGHGALDQAGGSGQFREVLRAQPSVFPRIYRVEDSYGQVFLKMGFEGFAHGLAPAENIGLDLAHGDAELGGNLFVAKAFHVEEDERTRWAAGSLRRASSMSSRQSAAEASAQTSWGQGISGSASVSSAWKSSEKKVQRER